MSELEKLYSQNNTLEAVGRMIDNITRLKNHRQKNESEMDWVASELDRDLRVIHEYFETYYRFK